MPTLPPFNPFPDMPRNDDGPLFAEPWQLTAFAIVYNLHQRGHFEWREWVDCLSDEIARNEDYGTDDLNTIYYNQWLCALETFVVDKGLFSPEELSLRREEWRHADEHREFGEPLRLHAHDDHHHDHGHHHAHDHHDGHGHGGAGAIPAPICRSPARRVSA